MTQALGDGGPAWLGHPRDACDKYYYHKHCSAGNPRIRGLLLTELSSPLQLLQLCHSPTVRVAPGQWSLPSSG
jgi:hypothetical protein